MTIAERICDASTRENHAAARLSERVARRIEDDIAQNSIPPGTELVLSAGVLFPLTAATYWLGVRTCRQCILEMRAAGAPV